MPNRVRTTVRSQRHRLRRALCRAHRWGRLGREHGGSADIINGEVKTADIGNGEVKAATSAAARSSPPISRTPRVTAAKLATDAVNAAKVLDNSLTGADINEATLSGVPSTPTGPRAATSTALSRPVIADAAVTLPKLDFDPATQAELDQLASDDGNGPNAGSTSCTGADWPVSPTTSPTAPTTRPRPGGCSAATTAPPAPTSSARPTTRRSTCASTARARCGSSPPATAPARVRT